MAFASTKRQLHASIYRGQKDRNTTDRERKKERKKDRKMASLSFKQDDVTVDIEGQYKYPYPSNFYTPSFVTLKLSCREKFNIWKTQIQCLLESHGMLGFIDGKLVSPADEASSSNVSGKGKVDDYETRHRLWRRSDALVKGWILGSLCEKTLTYVVARLHRREGNQADFSAKDVWDGLHTMYAPAVEEELARDTDHQELNGAALKGFWFEVDRILKEEKVTVIDKISNNGNTLLHVAVSNMKDAEYLESLLEKIPDRKHKLLNVQNSDGSTLLHVAAIVGNSEAAKILVESEPQLLCAKDNEGQTPLSLAFLNMHIETAKHLLNHIKTKKQKNTMFSGTTGDELLVNVISTKDFRLANDLAMYYTELHSDAVLMAIAQNFPTNGEILYYIGSGELNFRIDGGLEKCMTVIKSCLPPWLYSVFKILIILLFCGFYMISMLLMLILEIVVWRFREAFQIYNAISLLEKACGLLRVKKKHSGSYHHNYTNLIFEATRQNAYLVARTFLYNFPNSILNANEDGHTAFQYAVINRSEKVYNLLCQASQHRNIYRTIKDSSGNNLLHLAARLAPSSKLSLISGAALQIQRELQWFKEIEGFVCPLTIIQKNIFDETPQMIFTREHKDLVIEGEKWMKGTSKSFTITAALIITIVFAAAITVPGGSNQETGIPVFTNTTAFRIFAISDAISLFTAVTSLLMFLSILTARFAEKDSLFKLPTKLLIGLATLFISTTAMIVAFSATLYLVFGQSHSRILIPIVVLTCLPITSFVTLQFPLIVELISATYGPSLIGNIRANPFYYCSHTRARRWWAWVTV